MDQLNEASQWRLRLARSLTPAYTSRPAVAAVAVGGSVARGCADRHSDVELVVLWHEPPTVDQRRLAAPHVTGWSDHGYDADLDEWGDEYEAYGVKIDVSHRTPGGLERVISKVVDERDTSSRPQHVVSELLAAIALEGGELLDGMRRRADPYPEELVRAMVESHLRFGPHAWLERLVERDDVLALAEIHPVAVQAILGILLGLNRTYHPGSKWVHRTVRGFEIRPPDLSDRLRAVLGSSPAAAVRELGRLIADTVDLVDRHLPQVDTAGARARIARRLPVWDGPPPTAPGGVAGRV
jgi:Domain of unknown function (DUF4037)